MAKKQQHGTLTIQARQVQKYAEKKLRPLFDKDLSKLTSKNTSEIRAEIIEANSVTKVQPFIDFFKQVDFSLAGKKYIKLKKTVDQYINSNDDQITASISLVVDAYNNLVKDYNKDKGVQISHAGINVIAKHLFLLYTYLQLVGDRSITLITSAPPKNVEDATGKIIGYIPQTRAERINPRAVAAMAEEIRQLYTMSIALLSQPIQGNGSFEDLQSALENYFKTNDQRSHLATKVKVVDILTGTVKQELIFEESDSNKRRGNIEYLLGSARNNALQRRARRREIQQLRKTFAKDFDALSGSKKTNQELGTQVRDALTGNKPKRSASTTKAKGKRPKKDTKRFKVEKEGVVAELYEDEVEKETEGEPVNEEMGDDKDEDYEDEEADVADWKGMEKRIKNLEDAIADLKGDKEDKNEKEVEASEQVVEDVKEEEKVEASKTELSDIEIKGEPISHNPESEVKKHKVQFARGKAKSTLDRILEKLNQ